MSAEESIPSRLQILTAHARYTTGAGHIWASVCLMCRELWVYGMQSGDDENRTMPIYGMYVEGYRTLSGGGDRGMPIYGGY